MYQQIVIVGNLGREPEMKFTPTGTPVCSINVATNRKWTESDGKQVKETTWFRVSIFGKQAEAAAKFLHTGNSVLVEGRLSPDPTSGGPRLFQRKDETIGANFEVIANVVRFLGKADGKEETHANETQEVVDLPSQDNLPF